MPTSRKLRSALPRGPRRRLIRTVTCTAAAALLVSGVAAAAGTRVVSASSNQQLGKSIVVDVRGRTLYALSPETTHHILCKSKSCLQLWPPLTVRSPTLKLLAGPGVQGHLGLLRRAGGKWQVTLRGMPLYRYAGDGAKGQANGEGIMSFGGTWHAVTSAAHPSAPAMKEPAPSPPYGY